MNTHCRIGRVFIKSRLHEGDVAGVIINDPQFDFLHMEYGLGYNITLPPMKFHQFPKPYKRYRTRSGRMAWRNYKRNVTGGVSILEMLAIVREKAAAKILESM